MNSSKQIRMVSHNAGSQRENSEGKSSRLSHGVQACFALIDKLV